MPVESVDTTDVPGRRYYPAAADGGPDLDNGPYPLVAFMHGWLGNVDIYDDACAAVASEGFVVASIDTQTGLFLDIPSFTRETLELLTLGEQTASEPGGGWEGLVDGGDLVALGHSMGGGTPGSLVSLGPRVRTVVGFHPYEGVSAGYAAMAEFDGSVWYIAGDEDTTAPTPMTLTWQDTRGALPLPHQARAGRGRARPRPPAVRALGGAHAEEDPVARLDAYLDLSRGFVAAERVCALGMMSSDFNVVPEPVQDKTRELQAAIFGWALACSRRAREAGVFRFEGPDEAKAAEVVCAALGSQQLGRVRGPAAFEQVAAQIRRSLGVAGPSPVNARLGGGLMSLPLMLHIVLAHATPVDPGLCGRTRDDRRRRRRAGHRRRRAVRDHRRLRWRRSARDADVVRLRVGVLACGSPGATAARPSGAPGTTRCWQPGDDEAKGLGTIP